jgi:predicted metalloprotease
VDDNAFVDSGCAEGVLVALDADYVGASVARAEATIAHEWGHVIQAQATEIDLSLDPDGLPIDSELQADCLAGAWAAEQATVPLSLLRADVAGTGDEPDVAIDDPESHGTSEQRTAAFDLGTEGGPVACVDELVDALP